MSGLLTADTVIVFHHILGNVFVTDCSLLVVDAFPLQRFVKTKVGHNGCYNGISVQLAFFS